MRLVRLAYLAVACSIVGTTFGCEGASSDDTEGSGAAVRTAGGEQTVQTEELKAIGDAIRREHQTFVNIDKRIRTDLLRLTKSAGLGSLVRGQLFGGGSVGTLPADEVKSIELDLAFLQKSAQRIRKLHAELNTVASGSSTSSDVDPKVMEPYYIKLRAAHTLLGSELKAASDLESAAWQAAGSFILKSEDAAARWIDKAPEDLRSYAMMSLELLFPRNQEIFDTHRKEILETIVDQLEGDGIEGYLKQAQDGAAALGNEVGNAIKGWALPQVDRSGLLKAYEELTGKPYATTAMKPQGLAPMGVNEPASPHALKPVQVGTLPYTPLMGIAALRVGRMAGIHGSLKLTSDSDSAEGAPPAKEDAATKADPKKGLSASASYVNLFTKATPREGDGVLSCVKGQLVGKDCKIASHLALRLNDGLGTTVTAVSGAWITVGATGASSLFAVAGDYSGGIGIEASGKAFGIPGRINTILTPKQLLIEIDHWSIAKTNATWALGPPVGHIGIGADVIREY